MECTLPTPHQAIAQASLYLPSVRAYSTLSTPSISGRTPLCWPTSICSASHWEHAYRLDMKSTTERTPGRGLPQFGAQLLSGKLWGDRLSSAVWQANARSERKHRDELVLTNAKWLSLAVTTGWLLLPGAALAEGTVSEAASAVQQVIQSGGVAGTVDQAGGTGSGLEQVVVDKGLEASADQASAVGPADVTDLSDSLASGAVSILFVLAFVGLAALTIGVVYLAVSEFREKKEAEKEKLSRAPAAKPVEESSSGIVSGKGFGKKVEKVAKEKNRSK